MMLPHPPAHSPSTPQRPGLAPPTPNRTRNRLIVAVVAIVALTASACSTDSDEVVAEPGDLRHIHDFALDTDGTLLAASHTGLYRIEGLDRAVLVGTEQHDLMAMTQTNDGDLMASGHPDLRLPEYRVDGEEPHLGIIESGDMGHTWDQEGMLGDADFHAFAATPDDFYAAEATGGTIWYGNADGEWEPRGEAEINDLAVDPTNPDRLIGADLEGRLWITNDGARTWARLDADIAPIEIEWPAASTLHGIDESGRIWSTDDPGSAWNEAGAGPDAEPETLWIDDAGTWWLGTHGGDIWRSDNTGTSWTQIYQSLP